MKLKEIQDQIAEEFGMSKAQAERITKSLLTKVTASLTEDGKFRLGALGMLKVKERQARTCHNPKTKEAISVPKRKVPTFTPSKALKQAVNK